MRLDLGDGKLPCIEHEAYDTFDPITKVVGALPLEIIR